ncbi:hypothetical protein [Pseudonocardia sp. McavD-2-B]|uniref:hypothetical protein n=1 Tax=Pseudonocardia sp. McavD-2-B TaxID=2954499 RepID=UPI0020969E76|nr:hypothetical protein [Pseudonocardia sp. McavD-2-B]MCO7196233.1 hypothetical protein [Pseudonocardia sp. McavD-2-B]
MAAAHRRRRGLPTALVLWSQREPLPSPAEGAALLVEAATGREHSGGTADCPVLDGDDPVLGCRMHDDEDRHGWRTVRVDGTWVEGYRGRTPQEVVRTRWDVPVSADGVAELDVVVPGPGPTGTHTSAGVLMSAVRDPLRAAGQDAVLLSPRCPPVAEGATVACRIDGVPATVEVTRVSGADHRVRLTVAPRP